MQVKPHLWKNSQRFVHVQSHWGTGSWLQELKMLLHEEEWKSGLHDCTIRSGYCAWVCGCCERPHKGNEGQQDCLQRNVNRYRPFNIRAKSRTLHKHYNGGAGQERPGKDQDTNWSNTAKFKPRTAVVLRSWLHRDYTDDDLYYIRSIIMELSLLSGAEYEVVLLVDAKDTELPDPSDREGLDDLKKGLPKELQDLAVFFNSKILEEWYSKIDIHVYAHILPIFLLSG